MILYILPVSLSLIIAAPVLYLLMGPYRKQRYARTHLQDLLQREVFDYAVFDIRSKEEYSKSHLPGAVHFPLEEIEYLPVEDMFLHIFVSGRKHSEIRKALTYLSENGYFNVYNLGSVSKWKFHKEQGYQMGIKEFTQIYQENRKKNESI